MTKLPQCEGCEFSSFLHLANTTCNSNNNFIKNIWNWLKFKNNSKTLARPVFPSYIPWTDKKTKCFQEDENIILAWNRSTLMLKNVILEFFTINLSFLTHRPWAFFFWPIDPTAFLKMYFISHILEISFKIYGQSFQKFKHFSLFRNLADVMFLQKCRN